MKRWIIRKPNENVSEVIRRETEVSKLCADVLASRGYESTTDAIDNFFSEEMFDPFLLIDMKETVDIINAAIDSGEKICIYGDYDCDGITSTVMLYSYLECMGADIMYRLPERNEGYGLNKEVVKEIADYGVKLIITVDNGISAHSEAELIYELGMKLLITDHHQPGETLPKAEAIINPHRKDCPSIFKNLCGAGVVLKLIAAMEGGDYNVAMEEYGELAAIGTIADVVELSGENRYIVHKGMELIENSSRAGIIALLKSSRVRFPLTSTSIAFGIAPRINVSGRFASPTLAAKLLLTEDTDEAEMLCEQLEKLNNDRKDSENDIVNDIKEIVTANPDIVNERVLVFSKKEWHHGIIGIIASRMVERFDKPCFMITIEGDNARGSARSFGGFSIYKALDYCKNVLTKYGGHVGAGGFSLKTEDIPEFNRLLQEYSRENFDIMPIPEMVAEKLVMPFEITVENVDDLKVLQPFGEGNPQPVFAIIGAEIVSITPLSQGVHTKLGIKYGNANINVLIFRQSPDELFLNNGDMIDLMVTLETQVYNNNKSVSIIVKDFRKNGMQQNKFFAAKDSYEKVKRNEELPKAYYSKICPDRQEFVTVYKKITEKDISIDTLHMSVMSDSMNYCKLSICVDVFYELGLIYKDSYLQTVRALKNSSKVDLENSELLKYVKGKL